MFIHALLAASHLVTQRALVMLLGDSRTCVTLQSAMNPAWDEVWTCGALVRTAMGAGAAAHAGAALGIGPREFWGWAHLMWWRVAVAAATFGAVITREASMATSALACLVPLFGGRKFSGAASQLAPAVGAFTLWLLVVAMDAPAAVRWGSGAAALAISAMQRAEPAEVGKLRKRDHAMLGAMVVASTLGLAAGGARPAAIALCVIIDALHCTPWRADCKEEEAAWIQGMVEIAAASAFFVSME